MYWYLLMYGTKEVYGGGGGCDVCIVFHTLIELDPQALSIVLLFY